jgi:hypothetical protein
VTLKGLCSVLRCRWAGASATLKGLSCPEIVQPNPLAPGESAYVSIRQHTSAYVSIRQHTSVPEIVQPNPLAPGAYVC